MRSFFVCILSTVAASAAFWTCFAACVVPEPPHGAPTARVIATWDPVACGDPHRVVIELADEEGVPRSASAPCNIGSLELDGVPYAPYSGRIYAWALGEDVRSIAPLEVEVDQRVVRLAVVTPR